MTSPEWIVVTLKVTEALEALQVLSAAPELRVSDLLEHALLETEQ